MKKRLSPGDLETLARLIDKYSVASVVAAAQKMQAAPGKKKRRPPIYKGNFAAIYGYIEFHRKQNRVDGRKFGVEAACRRLKARLDAATVTDQKYQKPSAYRMRSMYYEAQKRAESDPELRDLMKNCAARYESGGGAAGDFPLLVIETKEGPKLPIIDTHAIFGPTHVETKIVHK